MTQERPLATTSRRALLIGGSAALLAGCTGTVAAVGTSSSTSAAPNSTTPSSASTVTTTTTETTSATSTTSGSTPPGAMPGLAPVGDTPFPAYSAVDVPADRIAAAIGALDGIAADVMKRSGLPGMAVAAVHGGKVVYAKGFGVRELSKDAAVDADTVFQIASCSKSLGSTAICWAIAQKKVTWADPVVKHVPDATLSDPAVTKMLQISDCYSHRTGLPGGIGNDLEGFGFDREQILDRFHVAPLKPFRITYDYSNFGMTLGGQAVANAMGMTWEELQDKALYEPLRMTSSSSRYADFVKRTNKATLHAFEDKKFQPLYIRDPDPQSPAGGVSSSVNDLAKWLLLNLADGKLDGKQHLDAAALQEARNPHMANQPGGVPDARSGSYGYGFVHEVTSTGHVRWSHSGAFAVGAGTAYAVLPALDLGIVVLSNGAPVGAVESVAYSFTDLARTGVVERDWYGDFFGPIFAGLFVNHSTVAGDPPAGAKKPRAASAYVGTYTNDYVGDVEVTASGQTLTVTIGPKKLHATLSPWDGGTFSWLAPGGNGDPKTAITFAGDTDGRATTMTMEILLYGELRRKA